MFEPEPELPKIEFRVVGIIGRKEFQVCKCYVERLQKSFPKIYAVPSIVPMLDVEWHTFQTKMRREIGGEIMWSSKKMVMVFLNENYLGDDQQLFQYVAKKYRFSIIKQFEELGNTELIEYIVQEEERGNHFIYFTIAVDDWVIGSLIFKLHSLMVPTISHLFKRRCQSTYNSYTGTPIQRIVVPSWIQCGGWDLKHYQIACENYIFPHDRRGVLSMCHNGKHEDNSTQFFITLGSAPWMDYKYVAFGLLIHGEDVLQKIENIPTYYEAPLRKIQIVQSGNFTVCTKPDHKDLTDLRKFLVKKHKRTGLHDDVLDSRDTDTLFFKERYLAALQDEIVIEDESFTDYYEEIISKEEIIEKVSHEINNQLLDEPLKDKSAVKDHKIKQSHRFSSEPYANLDDFVLLQE